MPAETILIAEDQQLVATYMKSSLERLGYSVVEIAATGEDVIRTAEQRKPDLVLMDIHLQGGMDGIEAARQIHFGFDIPVIFVTGDRDDRLLERAKVAEPLGYILKPFSIWELQNTIEASLNYFRSTHKRNREALKSLELRYCDLFEYAIQGVFRVTRSGKFIDVNTSFAELLGYKSQKELLGLSVGAKDHFVHPKRHQELLKALKKSGYVKDFEFEAYRKDGTKIWLSQNTRMLHDSSSNELYFEGIVQDISKRKLAEKALESSLARHAALLAAIPDIIMEVDINKVYTWANSAGFEFFGDDVIGTEAAAYFEGEQNTYNVVDPLWCGDDKTIYVESWQRRKDSKKRLLAWRCHVLKDNQGEVIGALSSARDVTDRRQAEEALRQSEERFRLIADTIDDVFWMHDVEKGKTIYVSPAHERIWGCPWQDLHDNSKSFYDRIHPDDREGVAAALAFINGGLPFDHEYRIIRPDGEIRHIHNRAYPLPDETGQVRRYVGVARDVTSWKAAEGAIKESKDYLSQIINSIGDPIFVKDRNYRHVLVNDAMCAWTGKRREEMLGKTAHELFPRAEMDPLLEQEKLVFETGKECITENDITDPQGNRRTLMTKKSLLLGKKGNKQIVGVVRDITERQRIEEALRESEERYRTAIEQCNDGVVITKGVNYLFANKRFVEMFGYDKPEEIIGKQLSLIVHPDDSKRVEEFALRRQKGEAVASRYVHKGIRKNGESIDVEVSATRTVYRGEPVSLVYARDIAEQKKTEEQRQQLQSQLHQAQRLEAIGQLAAGIAHEINTPTQYVSDNTRFLRDAFSDLVKVMESYGRLLQECRGGHIDPALIADVDGAIATADLEYLSSEIPNAIRQSLEGLDRVATIVRAMKEFSHPGGEDKQTIDLNHAIENTVTVCRNEWKYVAEMALDLDSTLPLVPCLPGDFNQVILNLIVNAAHAIADAINGDETHKGTISISTRHDGGWAEIRIGDTGTGIPEKHRPKIFTPFFTTKEVGRGTGQGLAICRSVVVGKHGGTIDFETELGKGTVFIIRLPLHPDIARIKTNEKADLVC
jgi:two-component system NtrC family sensor kinase